MRWFDDDKIGCYLDEIGHRVERTKDGNEVKMVDLTLRVQPFTPELAVSFDNDVRAFLFNMNDGEPKPKLKSVTFNLPAVRQRMDVYLLPEGDTRPQIAFHDVEMSGPRARTEKGVDGFGLVFYASFGPVGKEELEYICNWHTQQRFVSFVEQQPALTFEDDAASDNVARHIPRRHPRGGDSAVSA